MLNDKIQSQVVLSKYTTFQIGGPAKFFIIVDTKDELIEAVNWAKAENLPIFILGGGSNLLIHDNGFPGLVIKLNNQVIEQRGDDISAQAGARLGDAVALSAEAGLSGLEWATGIPGTIGGAVRGNAGAYGSDTSNNLKEVEFYDLNDQQFKIWPKEKLNFSYRSSLFKQDTNKIVWRAVFALQPGNTEEIKKAIKDIIIQRAQNHPGYPSAGCTFKNLFATDEIVSKLDVTDKVKGGKLACGLVVDRLGLKGKMHGGAQVSEKHANFIVNRQQATAADVINLINEIKQEAKTKLDIDLEEEVQLVGF